MSPQDIIAGIIEDVRERSTRVSLGTAIEESIDDYIDRNATTEECVSILGEIGDVDLSDPRPDLSAGWPRVARQLAYNALVAKVGTETRGWQGADAD